jgi:TRAP-type transport system periplasmic protein
MRIGALLACLSLTVVTGGTIATSPAAAQNFTMKFGTATLNDDQHQYINIFKEEIEKATGGKITVQAFPQSQLGAIPRQIEGLQLGTVEGFVGPTDFYVGLDPRYGVFSAPTLFRDRDHAAKTVADPALAKQVLAMAESKGVIGIGIYSMAQHDYLGRTPIKTLEDFKGKKIRVNATALEREAMARLGASAAPMPLNEVLPALQRGVIDGTRSALSILFGFKYFDVNKTATVINDTMIVPMAAVSKPFMDKLPPELRKAVMDAGQRAAVRNQAWADTFHAGMRDKWKGAGGEVYIMPEAERAKIIAAMKSVGDEVTKSDPPVKAMLETVRATAAKF